MKTTTKTKFANIPLEFQISVGQIYNCPFTGVTKIWLGKTGERTFFEVDPGTDIKKCWAKLLKLKQYRNQFDEAGRILASI